MGESEYAEHLNEKIGKKIARLNNLNKLLTENNSKYLDFIGKIHAKMNFVPDSIPSVDQQPSIPISQSSDDNTNMLLIFQLYHFLAKKLHPDKQDSTDKKDHKLFCDLNNLYKNEDLFGLIKMCQDLKYNLPNKIKFDSRSLIFCMEKKLYALDKEINKILASDNMVVILGTPSDMKVLENRLIENIKFIISQREYNARNLEAV